MQGTSASGARRTGRASVAVLVAVLAGAMAGCSGGSSRGTPGTLSFGDAGLSGDAGDSPGSADGLGTLPVFGSLLIQGTLNPAFDDDWYLISVDVAASETLSIRLNPPTTFDYDLTILDSNFNVLVGSAQSGDVDEVVFISGYTGTIFIGVTGAFADDFGPDAYAVSFLHTP